ncbi:ATP-binding cassette domain-containing protein [bacterium RCC_150]
MSSSTMTTARSTDLAVVVRGLQKWFGDEHVLRDLAVGIGRGKVVALGENGSGKSTIIKILSGFYHTDPGGFISVGGDEFSAPITHSKSHAAGLRFVHQDLGLVDSTN